MTGNYWSIVKANISPDAPGGQTREDELNEWWNDHQGEYVEKRRVFLGLAESGSRA